jgi:hypothetical protein
MDKKELLAKATEKLERRPFLSEQKEEVTKHLVEQPANVPTAQKGAPELETSEVVVNGRGGGEKSALGIEPVVKKGITLRPSNIKKLEQLELSLRNRGLKPSQSGLIQIAIDRLQDGPQLEEECRKLVERDLRFK